MINLEKTEVRYLDSVNWKAKVTHVFSLKGLEQSIEITKRQLASDSKWCDEGMFVVQLVDGHHGCHIPTCFYEMLDLDLNKMCKPNGEWYWNEFLEVQTKVCDTIIKLMELDNTYPNHHFWIGTLEADGSLCFFMNEDEDYGCNEEEEEYSEEFYMNEAVYESMPKRES